MGQYRCFVLFGWQNRMRTVNLDVIFMEKITQITIFNQGHSENSKRHKITEQTTNINPANTKITQETRFLKILTSKWLLLWHYIQKWTLNSASDRLNVCLSKILTSYLCI